MQHPLHAHSLNQVDPLAIYPSSRGHWKCDNCHRQSGPSFGRPYHCSMCSYDLCQACIDSQLHMTPAHQHPLVHLHTSTLLYQESNGAWRCDSCQGLSTDMGQSHSYHCGICSFDLCQSCFESKTHPVHCHPIRKADTRIVYPGTSGSWMCDVCGTTSRLFDRFSYHCAECSTQFDVCDKCFEGCDSPYHSHRLVKADSHNVYSRFLGGWKCDQCSSTHNGPDDRWPWHCQQCEFDLCDTCMRSSNPITPGFLDVIPAVPHLVTSGVRGFGGSENPWAIRQEVITTRHHSPSDGPVEFRSERGNTVTYPDDTSENFAGVTGESQVTREYLGSQVARETSQVARESMGSQVARETSQVAREASQNARETTEIQVAKETRGTEGTDDSDTCIICLENPRNATLIHGDTGHCCCCWPCGQVLKRRHDPCPICRAPIEKVIRQYNS